MHSAKTIDELYSEVRDYDLVLCNDAPLALALNNRVDRARLGKFAYTMREFAREKLVDFIDEPIIGDIELVRRVSDGTGYDLRFVHAEIENIRRMQRFTSDVRSHLGKRSAKVWDEYTKYMTLERLIDAFEEKQPQIYANYDRIAVIGLEFYDNMDKKMLPPISDYDDIELMGYESYDIDEIRLLGNDKQIADCAVDIAERSDPKDVAIVLDSTGPIADAVRSALYRRQIPFINSLSVKDLHSIRNYLQFIRLALSYRTIKVREVRSLISSYRGRIHLKYDEYSLHRFFESGTLKDEHTIELISCMRDIREMTFLDVCTRCVPRDERSNIRILLAQMDCADSDVTEPLLEDLVYAVNNIGNLPHNEQIPQDEKEGVLIADCKNSIYVDRPIMIYAGLGSDWNRDMKGLDFLNIGQRKDEANRNDIKFNVLIQQGSVRFHFANATKGGKDAVPCVHFEYCMGGEDPVTRFSDICDNITCGIWNMTLRDRGVDHDCMDVDPSYRMPTRISSSAFKDYYSCPRRYLFRTLVSAAENEHTIVGNKIHDYAEFRISYPDIATQNPPDHYADMIADICAPLQAEEAAEVERSKIRLYCRAIDEMVSSNNLGKGQLRKRSNDKIESNMFFELYGLSDVSEYTEKKIMYADYHMEGNMDLYTDQLILDYKTGKKKDLKNIAEAMEFTSDFDDRGYNEYGFDFQPLYYLALARKEGDSPKVFKYFSTNEYYRQRIHGDPKGIDTCQTEIHVEDDDHAKMMSADVFAQKGHSEYRDVMLDVFLRHGDPSGWADDDDLRAELSSIGVRTKDIPILIKKMSDVVGTEVIRNKTGIAVSEDTLSRFIEVVKQNYDVMREDFYKGGPEAYPGRPAMDCSKCDYKDMCTFVSLKEVDSDAE